MQTSFVLNAKSIELAKESFASLVIIKNIEAKPIEYNTCGLGCCNAAPLPKAIRVSIKGQYSRNKLTKILKGEAMVRSVKLIRTNNTV
jgi:hypothetical protein